jgi:DNA-binding NarL/FixJ family response regulator
MSVRVLVVDDHPMMRAGLTALFDNDPGIEVVAAVGTTAEAVAEVERERPDVVLMDLQFNRAFEGAHATREIRGLPEPPGVLILTNFDTDADIIAAIEAGAAGYLLKDAAPEDITTAIRAAAAGETALAPSIATRLFARMQQPHSALSARELEVLALVASGHSNTDIARRLHLSETTVKSHLAHIYPKLGVSSRTAAVAEARNRGMISRV